MSVRSLQPVPPRLAKCLAAGLLALSLGGCLGRGTAEVTGSVDAYASLSANPSELRSQSETLGRRFDANPNDPAVAMAYGRVLRALGQTAQAAAVLQQAAIRNPNYLPVQAAYGKALVDAGRLKEASNVLAAAHRPERPDWRILSVQGAVADQTGDFASAQRFYEAALKIAPGEPSVLSNQGLSLALAKRLPEAERVLREAASHPRADARVRQNLALVLGLQGRFADSEAVLKRDLPPAEAAENAAAIRRMVSQPNSWKAIRQAEGGRRPAPASTSAAQAPAGSRQAALRGPE